MLEDGGFPHQSVPCSGEAVRACWGPQTGRGASGQFMGSMALCSNPGEGCGYNKLRAGETGKRRWLSGGHQEGVPAWAGTNTRPQNDSSDGPLAVSPRAVHVPSFDLGVMLGGPGEKSLYCHILRNLFPRSLT